MEERSRGEGLLELGRAGGSGQNGKAGQPSTTPGNDTNAQILEIIRRRQQEAKAQAKTVPPTTLLKQPDLPELQTPDGNAPRNLLESAQALAAQRKARDAASPAAQPTGLQPAVFRPGQRQQPAGFMPSGQGGIVKAQAPVPMPGPSRVPVPAPLPGQGSGSPLAGLDHLSNLVEEGLRRIAPFVSGGALSIAGLSPEGIHTLQSMAPAEPMPPLPPSEAQEGGPVNFPGQAPEQGKADSASGPLITPVPRETTPSTTGGYGGEAAEIPPLITVTMDDGSEGYELPGGARVIKSASAKANDRFDAARRKLYGRPSGEAAAKVLGGSRITTDVDARRISAELSKPGGLKEADADLETFVQDTGGSASDIKTYPNGAQVYNAPDGTRITRRDVSNEKYATNELVIARPGAKSDEWEEVFKVRSGKEGK